MKFRYIALLILFSISSVSATEKATSNIHPVLADMKATKIDEVVFSDTPMREVVRILNSKIPN